MQALSRLIGIHHGLDERRCADSRLIIVRDCHEGRLMSRETHSDGEMEENMNIWEFGKGDGK